MASNLEIAIALAITGHRAQTGISLDIAINEAAAAVTRIQQCTIQAGVILPQIPARRLTLDTGAGAVSAANRDSDEEEEEDEEEDEDEDEEDDGNNNSSAPTTIHSAQSQVADTDTAPKKEWVCDVGNCRAAYTRKYTLDQHKDAKHDIKKVYLRKPPTKKNKGTGSAKGHNNPKQGVVEETSEEEDEDDEDDEEGDDDADGETDEDQPMADQ